MKRWICQICKKSYINKFCGELKTFIRDSTLCESCKLTNKTIIIDNSIALLSLMISPIRSEDNTSPSSSNQSRTPKNLHFRESPAESNNTTSIGNLHSVNLSVPAYGQNLKESDELLHQDKELNDINPEHSPDLLRKIVVQCNDISNNFNDYYVRTTIEEISRIINKIGFRPLDEIKRVFGSCLREILQYDNNTLQKHCRTNSQEWKYWCSDVIIYFICRKIIFNKPIPICKETPEIPEIPEILETL